MKTKIALVLTLVFIASSFTGCIKPYNKPIYEVIEPSQTAFLIPLIGDTTSQEGFESEAFLAQCQVATKEVQIVRRWVQTGRMYWSGEYRDTVRLVVVERKPETREWTEDSGIGGSKNQGIIAQSKEGISFKAPMNISAQIDEADATRFLYRYNKKPLNEILDFEIRARIEGLFVEICSTMTMNEIRVSKEQIMKKVKDDIIPYFNERGINITTIGYKGEFSYLDATIQESINKVFKAEQELVAQQTINERIISESKAKATAAEEAANGVAKSNKIIQESLTGELIEYKKIETWNGQLPQVQGSGSNTIVDLR